MSRDYIKNHHARIDDAREAQLTDSAFRAYMNMYRLAGRLEAKGAFIENGRQLSIDEIAFKIRCKPDVLKSAISEMKKVKLIYVNGRGPQIADWNIDEQPDWDQQREKDKGYSKKHYDKKKLSPDNSKLSTDKHGLSPEKSLNLNQNQPNKTKPNKTKPNKPSTPTPPQTGNGSDRAGKAGSGKSKPSISFADLKTQKQRSHAELAMKILRSSGLRNPRLKDTSVYLATRNYKTNEDLTWDLLAALASAYDDDTAKDKGLIAAYRIENDQIPAHYRKPKHWTSIPREVLEAAKVNPESLGGNRWEIQR